MAGVAFNTVLKLQVDGVVASETFHDSQVRSVQAQQAECGELWSFCHTKKHNIDRPVPDGYRDVYTWTAMDPATKLGSLSG